MKSIIVTEGTSLIPIGKQGENNAVSVLFKVNTWRNEYGDGGVFTLNHKRATDTISYPVTTTLTNDGVLWLVNNADNAIVGYGECELRYTIGDVIKKSVTWRTLTVKALSPIGDTPPDPFESWYDNIITAGDRAEGFATAAAQSSTNAGESAAAAKISEDNAKASETAAGGYADTAETAKNVTVNAKDTALAAAQRAETAESNSEASKAAAQTAAETAESAKDEAISAKDSAVNASGEAQSYAANAISAARNAQTYSNGAGVSASAAESAKNAALDAKEAAAQSATAAANSALNASSSETNAAESERQAGLSRDAAAVSAQNAGQSEFAARGYAEDAEAAATDIQESVDGVAQEDTAQSMLDILTSISALLNGMKLVLYVDELPETGTEGTTYITPDGVFHYENGEYIQVSGSGDLNGFSLSRNADGSVTLGYTNPDDETDTDSVILPTNNTAEDVLSAFESIAESLAIIAGQN